MVKKTQLGQTGFLGEQVALKYLKDCGYDILATNVTYSWGEIDIIASLSDVFHFFEVKTADSTSKLSVALSERVNRAKLSRIKRCVKTYVVQKDLYERELQIDLIMIKLNHETKTARVKVIQNLH